MVLNLIAVQVNRETSSGRSVYTSLVPFYTWNGKWKSIFHISFKWKVENGLSIFIFHFKWKMEDCLIHFVFSIHNGKWKIKNGKLNGATVAVDFHFLLYARWAILQRRYANNKGIDEARKILVRLPFSFHRFINCNNLIIINNKSRFWTGNMKYASTSRNSCFIFPHHHFLWCKNVECYC